MINYYLQFFLPHPERKIVGIDKQFERTASPKVDLVGVRSHHRIDYPLFVSASNSA